MKVIHFIVYPLQCTECFGNCRQVFGVTKLHSNYSNGNRLVLCWVCIVMLKRTVSVGISWHIYYRMSAEFSLSFHLIYWLFLSCVTAINFWAVLLWVLLRYFSEFLHHQSPWRWRQFVHPKCLNTYCILNGVRTQKTVYIIAVQDRVSPTGCLVPEVLLILSRLTEVVMLVTCVGTQLSWQVYCGFPHSFGTSRYDIISATITSSIPFPNCSSLVLDSSWNVMAHGDTQEGKWRGNWRMEWVASALHTTSEHGVSSITTADVHTSAANSWLNWRPRWFKWTRPFRQKTKSGFCTCAITFQLASTVVCSEVQVVSVSWN
jgi:hypothetical protein